MATRDYIGSDIVAELEWKPVRWLGTSQRDIREQREAIRNRLGLELQRVQHGLKPLNSKSMRTVGPGAFEIRVSAADGIARLMYVAKFRNTVHVLHVFTKKSQRTPQSDIDLAKQRYKEAKNG